MVQGLIQNNEQVAEQLRYALMNDETLKESLRSQKEGFISIFIRNGNVGKLSYKKSELDSDILNYDDLEENFSDKWNTPIVPENVYLRFCYLLSTAVLYMGNMEYGTLRFKFVFNENEEGLWQEQFKATFDHEIPFKDGRPYKKFDK